MKSIFALIGGAALLVIAGCGGGQNASSISGNYALQGNLTQGGGTFLGGPLIGSGSNITGGFHILDSNQCFDPAANVAVSGSLGSGGKITINTAAAQAQTFQITATVSADGSTISNGTYKVTGGCAAGLTGSIAGFRVDPFTGSYSGTLTVADIVGNPTGVQFAATADLTQAASADANGYFAVSGPVAINSACFTGFQLAGSQIFGTQAVFVLTPNAAPATAGSPALTLNIYATDATAKTISGNYTAANMTDPTCNSSGFVALAHP
ncbi:MAG: hypothetical protein ABI383_15555 [Acidobacteriaceae bacterium]